MQFSVREVQPGDADWVLEIARTWGADYIISRGRAIYPHQLPGFLAETRDGKRVGLVTYEVIGDQCEIVTLDAFEKYSGVGTALTQAVIDKVRKKGCSRLWLITTNDNLDAIRFYQRRGFTIAAVHPNALARSRELKPSIPEIGQYGIPIRDEIEFEMSL